MYQRHIDHRERGAHRDDTGFSNAEWRDNDTPGYATQPSEYFGGSRDTVQGAARPDDRFAGSPGATTRQGFDRHGGHPDGFQRERAAAVWEQPGRFPGDDDYQRWRSEQLRRADADYQHWREERYRRFSDDFDSWRRERRQASEAELGLQRVSSGSQGMPVSAGSDLGADDGLASGRDVGNAGGRAGTPSPGRS
ncbi:hypothetical protein [Eleftheria terrae]|uniref:hypothetical protein n=1 Tax=Eleftheria terrae TaxID=1597781 RepID=UPI00263AB437|nr:hypothetical protein [Eleftheria terrae]WKB53366.1 hypothetical protein N7L95_02920 [Eleftheria terrae]